jgi:hypothetical protein
MSEWQPIATAPHAESVLLFCPATEFMAEEIVEGWASGGTLYPNGYSSRWWHARATHWQPLPAAPQPQEMSDE